MKLLLLAAKAGLMFAADPAPLTYVDAAKVVVVL